MMHNCGKFGGNSTITHRSKFAYFESNCYPIVDEMAVPHQIECD